MKILILDNYDSFTYNLARLVADTGCDFEVVRNDQLSSEAVAGYDKLLLSPGPGLPEEAGQMQAIIRQWAPHKSILGICLGHQGIAQTFGASLYNLPEVLHGVATTISLTGKRDTLFQGIPDTFQACLYHSWAVEAAGLPDGLEITAVNENGLIMGLKHREYEVRGLQFHPESVLTPEGADMLRNWIAQPLQTYQP
jgi:anthranilate synthase component II